MNVKNKKKKEKWNEQKMWERKLPEKKYKFVLPFFICIHIHIIFSSFLFFAFLFSFCCMYMKASSVLLLFAIKLKVNTRNGFLCLERIYFKLLHEFLKSDEEEDWEQRQKKNERKKKK